MRRFIIVYFLLTCSTVFPQDPGSCGKIYFFPSQKIFSPARASVIEARNGVLKQLDKNYLLLNIGTSFDIAGLKTGNTEISAGVDFFTFSNLRSEANFKFPVDAIDYLFGVNFNLSKSSGSMFSSRFRISHISSHLVDGHKYARTDTIFTPFVYSREFFDLTGCYELKLPGNLSLKNYLGINYLFHSIPGEFGAISLQYDIETNYFINRLTNIYLSNSIKFVRIRGESKINENMEAGVRLGRRNSTGISIYFAYYDGIDYKGQYYDKYLNYKSIGVSFDF